MSISAISTALTGLKIATAGINKTAENISAGNNIEEELVSLKKFQLMYLANLKVIEVASDLEKHTINIIR